MFLFNSMLKMLQKKMRKFLTCIPENALSDNLLMALYEKSSLLIGKLDVENV